MKKVKYVLSALFSLAVVMAAILIMPLGVAADNEGSAVQGASDYSAFFEKVADLTGADVEDVKTNAAGLEYANITAQMLYQNYKVTEHDGSFSVALPIAALFASGNTDNFSFTAFTVNDLANGDFGDVVLAIHNTDLIVTVRDMGFASIAVVMYPKQASDNPEFNDAVRAKIAEVADVTIDEVKNNTAGLSYGILTSQMFYAGNPVVQANGSWSLELPVSALFKNLDGKHRFAAFTVDVENGSPTFTDVSVVHNETEKTLAMLVADEPFAYINFVAIPVADIPTPDPDHPANFYKKVAEVTGLPAADVEGNTAGLEYSAITAKMFYEDYPVTQIDGSYSVTVPIDAIFKDLQGEYRFASFVIGNDLMYSDSTLTHDKNAGTITVVVTEQALATIPIIAVPMPEPPKPDPDHPANFYKKVAEVTEVPEADVISGEAGLEYSAITAKMFYEDYPVTQIDGSYSVTVPIDAIFKDLQGEYRFASFVIGNDLMYSDSTLTYDKNAGTITVVVTEQALATIPIIAVPLPTSIIPTDVTVTPPTDITYGETLGDPIAEAAEGDVGTFIYHYYGLMLNDEVYDSDEKPSEPGEYTVTATLVSDTHEGSGEAGFTINQAELTWGEKGTVTSKPYDGDVNAHVATLPTIEGVLGSDIVTVLEGTVTYAASNVAVHAVTAVDFGIQGDDAWKYTIDGQPEFEDGEIIDSDFTAERGVHYTISTLNDDGYAVDTNGNAAVFVVTAMSGFELSLDAGTWESSLTYADDTANGNAVFYVRETATGDLSAPASEAYKVDLTAPTAKINIRSHEFAMPATSTAYKVGLYFKDSVTITVDGTDDGSGVATHELYLTENAEPLPSYFTDWETLAWINDTSVEVSAVWKGFVYARVRDELGNTTIVRSDGVIVFMDSQPSADGTFMLGSTDNLFIPLDTNGNELYDASGHGLSFNNDTLDPDDVAMTSDGIVFFADFLELLGPSDTAYEFELFWNPLGEQDDSYYELEALGVTDIDAPNTTRISIMITAVFYDITYNTNGGEVIGTWDEYAHGVGLTLPIPQRLGYTFEGWYDNADLTGDPITRILPTETGDKEFWADWSLTAMPELTVELTADVGIVTLEAQTPEAGFSFYYDVSNAEFAVPLYLDDIGIVADNATPFTTAVEIPTTELVWVSVYKVNTSGEIVAFGQASKAPELGLEALTVTLTAGEEKLTLQAQTVEAGFRFFYMYTTDTMQLITPILGQDIATIPNVEVYSVDTDIYPLMPTVFVNVAVYKVNDSDEIVGYGVSGHTPTPPVITVDLTAEILGIRLAPQAPVDGFAFYYAHFDTLTTPNYGDSITTILDSVPLIDEVVIAPLEALVERYVVVYKVNGKDEIVGFGVASAVPEQGNLEPVNVNISKIPGGVRLQPQTPEDGYEFYYAYVTEWATWHGDIRYGDEITSIPHSGIYADDVDITFSNPLPNTVWVYGYKVNEHGQIVGTGIAATNPDMPWHDLEQIQLELTQEQGEVGFTVLSEAGYTFLYAHSDTDIFTTPNCGDDVSTIAYLNPVEYSTDEEAISTNARIWVSVYKVNARGQIVSYGAASQEPLPEWDDLAVVLDSGIGSVILQPQTPVAGHTFYYAYDFDLDPALAPAYGADFGTISDVVGAYTDEAEIETLTSVRVRVYKVHNATNKIVGFGWNTQEPLPALDYVQVELSREIPNNIRLLAQIPEGGIRFFYLQNDDPLSVDDPTYGDDIGTIVGAEEYTDDIDFPTDVQIWVRVYKVNDNDEIIGFGMATAIPDIVGFLEPLTVELDRGVYSIILQPQYEDMGFAYYYTVHPNDIMGDIPPAYGTNIRVVVGAEAEPYSAAETIPTDVITRVRVYKVRVSTEEIVGYGFGDQSPLEPLGGLVLETARGIGYVELLPQDEEDGFTFYYIQGATAADVNTEPLYGTPIGTIVGALPYVDIVHVKTTAPWWFAVYKVNSADEIVAWDFTVESPDVEIPVLLDLTVDLAAGVNSVILPAQPVDDGFIYYYVVASSWAAFVPEYGDLFVIMDAEPFDEEKVISDNIVVGVPTYVHVYKVEDSTGGIVGFGQDVATAFDKPELEQLEVTLTPFVNSIMIHAMPVAGGFSYYYVASPTPIGEPVRGTPHSGGTAFTANTYIAANVETWVRVYKVEDSTGEIIGSGQRSAIPLTVEQLIDLDVVLNAGQLKATLEAQPEVAGHTYYYTYTTIDEPNAPIRGDNISTIPGRIGPYNVDTDIAPLAAWVTVYVRVYMVDSTTNEIVGFGIAQAEPFDSPATGVPDVGGYAMAMVTFSALSVALWGYVVLAKRRERRLGALPRSSD
ncbi:MAG: InlB B-repeat-containing protein [Defluviitaleaceae bacterium]|nr:InlB B-repeat-containing protein [Defluviitaleaceae bacterium]